jgi:hypothetical protein
MNRRKSPKRKASDSNGKRPTQPPSEGGTSPPEAAESVSSGRDPDGGDGLPSSGVRAFLSIWLPLHLFAIFISFSAVVEPSGLHASLQGLLRPYLQVTHFDADDRLVYLAHGEATERAHRLQVSTNEITNLEGGAGDQGWTTIGPRGKVVTTQAGREIVESFASRPGLAESDRYARWLTTAATLAENEQPGLVAELLLPVVRSDQSIKAIRIERLMNDLDSTVEESLPPPYMARVVRNDDRVALVQLQATRLSAVAPVNRSPPEAAEGDADE